MGLTRRVLLGLVGAITTGDAEAATTTDTESGFGYGEGAYGETGYGGMAADCFIATAACGTDGHADVATLRRFRDDVLLQNRPGRLAVKTYYALSPPIARWISRSPRRRATVRRLLVSPASRLTAAISDD